MCDEGPPSYALHERKDSDRLRRETAIAQVCPDTIHCVHYSSIREITTSQNLVDKISDCPKGARTHIEHLHQVPSDTSQDPRNQWLRKMEPTTGSVIIINDEEDPWDLATPLFLPKDASPVDPGPDRMNIYTNMIIGHRGRNRKFIDQQALERCKKDVQLTITYALGRAEAAAADLDEEIKHIATMAYLGGDPTEMLDRAYNLYRMENHGINLDDYPEYRSYQTFYEMGIAPPTHQEMADIVIQAVAASRTQD